MFNRKKVGLIAAFLAAVSLSSGQVHANTCNRVDFSLVGWTDLKVTTAVTQVLLEQLGYETGLVVSDQVGDIYDVLASGDSDVFLGNWMPANSDAVTPYIERGDIEVVITNLTGAVYTIAVPQAVYDAGVTDVRDLSAHADRFRSRIYGLEKGNSGNRMVQAMIDQNDFGLSGFTLIESSELIMLAQVRAKTKKNEWLAFLGWKPHPMNRLHNIAYLDGADEYFGPDKGSSHVRTLTRRGYQEDCPNVTKLLNNLKFTIPMQEAMMDQVQNEFVPVRRAAHIWMNKNPDILAQWLKGVVTIDGKQPDAEAIAERLKVGFGRL